MESPFFRNHQYSSRPLDHSTTYWGTPRGESIPIRQQQAKSSSATPIPKVVSIPVHFVGSEKPTRSVAALRIQKVFRGFLIRKSVKKIVGIKKEADKIENHISAKETVDLIRKDGRERLKVNEMLMALLLRLDSVRGFDSGVRDCRKAVTKKVIRLQERLDSIISGDEPVIESRNQEFESQAEDSIIEAADQTPEIKDVSTEKNLHEASVEVNGKSESKESPGKNQSFVEEDENYVAVKKDEEEMEIEHTEEVIQGGEEASKEVERRDESKMVMQRMIEGNEVLIGLVTDLCEKNKMHTEMINSLSKRVDNLEKALKKERSKSKRRKSVDAKKS